MEIKVKDTTDPLGQNYSSDIIVDKILVIWCHIQNCICRWLFLQFLSAFCLTFLLELWERINIFRSQTQELSITPKKTEHIRLPLNSITCYMVLLNSTDEQARQLLVCSLCEMLNNVKTEKFTLVFLRDHLVFTSCMTAERTDTESEECASSNSPGTPSF